MVTFFLSQLASLRLRSVETHDYESMIGENRQFITDEPVHTRATPGGSAKNISPTYSPEI